MYLVLLIYLFSHIILCLVLINTDTSIFLYTADRLITSHVHKQGNVWINWDWKEYKMQIMVTRLILGSGSRGWVLKALFLKNIIRFLSHLKQIPDPLGVVKVLHGREPN